MLAGAKQEGTCDVAYSRNQPSVLENDREPQRQSGARSGAQQTSNPKRIADSEDPRHATPGNWQLLQSVTLNADLATDFRPKITLEIATTMELDGTGSLR